jgi:endonuclease/exonuclease/phosphatase family metal-dependent hydrolase
MRFLLYNIRYGTGTGRRIPLLGYLGRTHAGLTSIARFIESQDPDVVGLVEVDAGSYRTAGRNQARDIAEAMGHYHVYGSKYKRGHLVGTLPLMCKQGNAFLSRDSIRKETFHYFNKGIKRLVIELELEDVTFFLVHLALGHRIRHDQLRELHALVRSADKPHIVAGDFNPLWHDKELDLFMAAAGLQNANAEAQPTFPSRNPRRQLDFVLYSPGIEIERFDLPAVALSDHLPVVCDFRVA